MLCKLHAIVFFFLKKNLYKGKRLIAKENPYNTGVSKTTRLPSPGDQIAASASSQLTNILL
jgi:hypothetical protein